MGWIENHWTDILAMLVAIGWGTCGFVLIYCRRLLRLPRELEDCKKQAEKDVLEIQYLSRELKIVNQRSVEYQKALRAFEVDVRYYRDMMSQQDDTKKKYVARIDELSRTANMFEIQRKECQKLYKEVVEDLDESREEVESLRKRQEAADKLFDTLFCEMSKAEKLLRAWLNETVVTDSEIRASLRSSDRKPLYERIDRVIQIFQEREKRLIAKSTRLAGEVFILQKDRDNGDWESKQDLQGDIISMLLFLKARNPKIHEELGVVPVTVNRWLSGYRYPRRDNERTIVATYERYKERLKRQ